MRNQLATLGMIAMVTACGPAAGVVGLRDTLTVHNPDATHVWVFQKDPAGNDFILYCDSGWPASNHPLCVRYPSSYAQEQAPAPVATVQLVQPVAPSPK